jgi:hypothetical protein
MAAWREIDSPELFARERARKRRVAEIRRLSGKLKLTTYERKEGHRSQIAEGEV